LRNSSGLTGTNKERGLACGIGPNNEKAIILNNAEQSYGKVFTRAEILNHRDLWACALGMRSAPSPTEFTSTFCTIGARSKFPWRKALMA